MSYHDYLTCCLSSSYCNVLPSYATQCLGALWTKANVFFMLNVWEFKKYWISSAIYYLLWVSEVTQLCPTLCDPMDCSLPGSSVHGILQARVVEWVAISFFRGSSWPRDWTWVSHIGGRHFNLWDTREALLLIKYE